MVYTGLSRRRHAPPRPRRMRGKGERVWGFHALAQPGERTELQAHTPDSWPAIDLSLRTLIIVSMASSLGSKESADEEVS
jgi:hypothetical protein